MARTARRRSSSRPPSVSSAAWAWIRPAAASVLMELLVEQAEARALPAVPRFTSRSSSSCRQVHRRPHRHGLSPAGELGPACARLGCSVERTESGLVAVPSWRPDLRDLTGKCGSAVARTSPRPAGGSRGSAHTSGAGGQAPRWCAAAAGPDQIFAYPLRVG